MRQIRSLLSTAAPSWLRERERCRGAAKKFLAAVKKGGQDHGRGELPQRGGVRFLASGEGVDLESDLKEGVGLETDLKEGVGLEKNHYE